MASMAMCCPGIAVARSSSNRARAGAAARVGGVTPRVARTGQTSSRFSELRGSALRIAKHPLPGRRIISRGALRVCSVGIINEQFTETTQKALAINLDPSVYGSFAEIGAGQEVARWFFSVGAAAGTVAKSVSAYDMTISDTFYGQCDRYVTQERLESMLEYEYVQCTLPLKKARGAETRFFAFADTVVARAYGRKNECHGWLGVKWQTKPGSAPSRLMVHIRMLDETASEQQEALGVFGVNFLHMAFYNAEMIAESAETAKSALNSLINDLSTDRIEVDLIRVDGPDFSKVDNRVLALHLVDNGLTDAAFFNSDGEVGLPADYLRRQKIIIQRGTFNPPTILNADILNAATKSLQLDTCDYDFNGSSSTSTDPTNFCDSTVVMELTLKDLRESGDTLNWTETYAEFLKRSSNDFLDRVDSISAMGYPCLVSNYFEYFELSSYLRRATKESVIITMGVPTVVELFKQSYYDHLDGGILENFGRLVTAGLKIFVYPMLGPDGNLITADNLELEEDVKYLYDFMYNQGAIVAMDTYDIEVLRKIGSRPSSRTALEMIRKGDPEWENLVTPQVRDCIKDIGMFGYDEKK